jgi:hypothetical protein
VVSTPQGEVLGASTGPTIVSGATGGSTVQPQGVIGTGATVALAATPGATDLGTAEAAAVAASGAGSGAWLWWLLLLLVLLAIGYYSYTRYTNNQNRRGSF